MPKRIALSPPEQQALEHFKAARTGSARRPFIATSSEKVSRYDD